jgi:hypothetical protein
MINLIIFIIWLWIDNNTEVCANLAYQQDRYVITYNNIDYKWEYFYKRYCNDTEVQEYILNIKKWLWQK